jgi:hypothetical protein
MISSSAVLKLCPPVSRRPPPRKSYTPQISVERGHEAPVDVEQQVLVSGEVELLAQEDDDVLEPLRGLDLVRVLVEHGRVAHRLEFQCHFFARPSARRRRRRGERRGGDLWQASDATPRRGLAFRRAEAPSAPPTPSALSVGPETRPRGSWGAAEPSSSMR